MGQIFYPIVTRIHFFFEMSIFALHCLCFLRSLSFLYETTEKFQYLECNGMYFYVAWERSSRIIRLIVALSRDPLLECTESRLHSFALLFFLPIRIPQVTFRTTLEVLNCSRYLRGALYKSTRKSGRNNVPDSLSSAHTKQSATMQYNLRTASLRGSFFAPPSGITQP